MDERMYILQPSFAAGEISPEVANRVDLDKYQSALLQAENVFIRPYGAAYRRPGTLYIDDLYNGDVRIQEFAANTSDGGYLLVFIGGYLYIYQDKTLKATVSTPYTGVDLKKLRFAQSADIMFITSGAKPVQMLKRLGDTSWTMTEFVPTPGYIDGTTNIEGVTITPSATTGTITLTSSANAFTADQVGNWIQIKQDVASQTETLELNSGTQTGTSSSILAGAVGWKVISHGTWTGTFSVEYSSDNSTWKTLRTYTSANDYNPTESGTFDEPTYIRVTGTITSGSVKIDLTRFPYVNTGMARITAYTDAKHVTASVKDKLSSTSATDNWAFGSWSAEYGYPSCVTFFQDRLCFAATERQPYMVWMSRTGDYANFGTEEVSGTLTDDSAVALSFISRKDFKILHLVAHSDLMIMTEGNEWVISGSETVKPTSVTPRVQTSRGCTDVEPVLIGGQIIFVQKHGKTVRDMQYNYASDSYDGMDLIILAKHITRGTKIVDCAYRQEPDYMAFFVLEDGTCACLTYVNEQKVYAWSRMVTYNTDGSIASFKAVDTVSTPYGESVYFVVDRDGRNRLEGLTNYSYTDWPYDYCMLDSARGGENVGDASDTITIAALANKTVDVLADGRHYRNMEADENGVITLPVPVWTWIVGVPYKSIWELPNIEIQTRDGTMQGRRKKVAEAILRLDNSLGGRVGMATDKTDVIKYDELMNEPVYDPDTGDLVEGSEVYLFTGEKRVTVPNVTIGGFNDKGRVVITSDEPYPLSIASIVRVVVLGG